MDGPHELIRYEHTWRARPWIGALLAPVVWLLAAAPAGEDWIVHGLCWGTALVVAAVALGSCVSTRVRVDGAGALRVRHRILGLPLSTLMMDPRAVHRVELHRKLVSSRGRFGASGKRSLRQQLRLHCETGTSIVTASANRADDLPRQGALLSEALECPYERTGRV